MLTFTHGQPITPSDLKYQFSVYTGKLYNIWDDLFKKYEYKTCSGGSNGQLTGLKYCYPISDWDNIISDFTNNYLKISEMSLQLK